MTGEDVATRGEPEAVGLFAAVCPERVVINGLVVQLTTLQLLWDLEERGFCIVVENQRLLISPAAELTDADDAALRTHGHEFRSLVGVVCLLIGAA